jgi:hypothetical protein
VTQQEFANTYHRKRVRVVYPNTEPFEGIVTAALLDYGENGRDIIAVMSDDGPPPLGPPSSWRTYEITPEELQYFTVLPE